MKPISLKTAFIPEPRTNNEEMPNLKRGYQIFLKSDLGGRWFPFRDSWDRQVEYVDCADICECSCDAITAVADENGNIIWKR